MDAQTAIDLGRQAVVIALLIGAPVLLVGMLVGLLIGLLQALTQIQDQTVAFVPKIVAMVVVLALCLPWLIQQMCDYSENLFMNIPRVMSGG
ncbi:MAG: flagellar biosynthesis protein FliQ [Pirellulaceae bacterium]